MAGALSYPFQPDLLADHAADRKYILSGSIRLPLPSLHKIYIANFEGSSFGIAGQNSSSQFRLPNSATSRMEHITDSYGLGYIPVSCMVPRVCRCGRSAHGPGYVEFINFPAEHGWGVNETTYEATPLEVKDHRFVMKQEEFFQSWLFFTLLNCVVRNGNPVLSYQDLTQDGPVPGKGIKITTENLDNALEAWYTYEHQNRGSAKRRLIQADLILEYARRIVRANLAEDDKKRATEATTQVHDSVALAIMVLGETLAAAKRKIVLSIGVAIRGWQGDEKDGWGRPRYVSSLMVKKNFCPYTRKLLKMQMGSSATLLLAAMDQHSESTDHPDCRDDGCIHIPASRKSNSEEIPATGPQDSKIIYKPQCHLGSTGGDSCGDQDCKPIGPNMDTVYGILEELSDRDESRVFPLFYVRRVQGRCQVEVHKWETGYPCQRFATISHVWSQGMGNEKENKVKICQLNFLTEQLNALTDLDWPTTWPQETLSPFFWLDTFAIPVKQQDTDKAEDEGKQPESSNGQKKKSREDLRKLAIRQIRHVFVASSHSIVVDKGLCAQKPGRTALEVSVKLLTSSWMRRLWTLQEAFLSKKMTIPFDKSANEALEKYNFDELMQQLSSGGTGFLKTILSGALRAHLYENLMVEGRETWHRKNELQEVDGSLLIAHAWRSVRWRVSLP